MPLQKRIQTTPTRAEFLSAFYRAWHYTEGRPSLLAGAILFAQFAFETAWGKHCYNWNLGNVRAFDSYIKIPGNDWFDLPGAWEIVNGQRVIAGGNFRSHSDLDAGMVAHLEFLDGLSRYEPAFVVLQTAAVSPLTKENAAKYGRKFVEDLKAGGYFTGPLTDYSNGVVSITKDIVDMELDLPDTEREPRTVPTILGPDPEFAGFGATTVADVFARWAYDECMTADFLACRWDADGVQE